jgi:hypothetical protein
MDGSRSEILGAPGGRTRYPITMRQIKLDAPIDTSAMIKTKGVIVDNNSFSSLNGRAAGYSGLVVNQGFPG